MNSSFECHNSTNSILNNNEYIPIYNCTNEIGFTKNFIIRYIMILFSLLGLIVNFIILLNFFFKNKKKEK
jgi:hypothetical protein